MYLALRDDTSQTVQKFFEKISQAEEARVREGNAALILQRSWRAYNSRIYLRYLSEQAGQIQRIWKGFNARKRVKQMIIALEQKDRQTYYDSCAINIQKRWRGYLSRKVNADFYQRARFIHQVSVQSQEHNMNAEYEVERQRQEDNEINTQKAAIKFEKMASNLHHLVSTRNIPGIFQSRFGEANHRTAYEVPMDQHLWDAFRNNKLQKENESLLRHTEVQARSLHKERELPQVRTPAQRSLAKTKTTRNIKVKSHAKAGTQFRAHQGASRHRTGELPQSRYPQKIATPPPADIERPKMGNPRYIPRKRQSQQGGSKQNSPVVQGKNRTQRPGSPGGTKLEPLKMRRQQQL